MRTIVFLHAHPDDESSLTAGTMAMAHDRGDRVVEVFATSGELGEKDPHAPETETVLEQRRREAEEAAGIIGVDRVEWLGYRDSGMTGWSQNADPRNLISADVDEVASRLAGILDEEKADYLVGYDWHGTYGHPDHIRVHEVMVRAGRLAECRPRVLEATTHQEERKAMIARGIALGILPDDGTWDPETRGDDGRPVGVPEKDLTWAVELTEEYLGRKRRALACHASQCSDVGFFLSLPPELFAVLFHTEYYVDPSDGGDMRRGWPFQG